MPLSKEARGLIDGANFAHLATLMPDGSPQNAPVWVGREGDNVLICTGEASLKARNTRRDPRVALIIHTKKRSCADASSSAVPIASSSTWT